MASHFASIEKALEAIRLGKMIILVDNENRENEGDLVLAAEKITPEAVNFMISEARGLLCLSIEEEVAQRLQLPMMVEHNHSNFNTPFTISIEAATGVTTGISVHDRAKTILAAINPKSGPADIVMPGHVFPLKARAGGVLTRMGHTEASVDMVKLAGLNPSGVICEILNKDGSVARLPELIKFAKQHNILLVSINDLVAYRLRFDNLVEEIASSILPIQDRGEFKIIIFKNHLDNLQHMALIKGEIGSSPQLVRVHSECLTGDTFNSSRCDCGWQLDASIKEISDNGGVLLYMRQEGRGIGLANKILAYSLQDKNGLDTVEANHKLGFDADQREYSLAAQMLAHLGISRIKLLTNNPSKISALKEYGIDVVERIPIEMPPTETTKIYLEAKKNKLGHLLTLRNS